MNHHEFEVRLGFDAVDYRGEKTPPEAACFGYVVYGVATRKSDGKFVRNQVTEDAGIMTLIPGGCEPQLLHTAKWLAEESFKQLLKETGL